MSRKIIEEKTKKQIAQPVPEPLLDAVARFLRVYEDWCVSDESLLTTEFEESLVELVRLFGTSDLPSGIRRIAAAVADLADQWDQYTNYVTLLKPDPTARFWRAIDHLRLSVEATATARRRALEPVAVLIEQKVSFAQIANHIYGDRSQGPFLKNGVVQEDLILKEAQTPGTVIPPDWTHPADVFAEQAALASTSAALKRLSKRFEKPPIAPESVEELLRGRVPVEQIAEMKHIGLDAVISESERLGIAVHYRENLSNLRAPQEPEISPEDAAAVEAWEPSEV